MATLRRQVRALANLELRSVDDVVRGLGLSIGPSIQVHEHRREWPLQPSAALEGGMIMEGGRDIIVELTPSRGLNATFVELAPVLMDLSPDRSGCDSRHPQSDHPATVTAVFFTPERSRLWPESMMRTLTQRRRHARK